MPDFTIRCRVDGPLVVDGPVTVVDHLGNRFPINSEKPSVALCRCGHSAKKPFCDGSHKTCGFVAQETAPVGD
jgi:CDGSH-type Zn-finger protein